MAMTKQSCFDQGRAAPVGTNNPFRAGSWQAAAWADGHSTVRSSTAVPAAVKAKDTDKDKDTAMNPSAGEILAELGVSLADFPARMPQATRNHICRLHIDALGTTNSTRAVRLDSKITALYQRWE